MANEELLIKKALADIGSSQTPVEMFHNVVTAIDEEGKPTQVLPADVMLVAKLDELTNLVQFMASSIARIADALAPIPYVPEDEGEENDPALD